MATIRKCGTCREPGHTRATCPNNAPTPATVADEIVAEQPTPEQRAEMAYRRSGGAEVELARLLAAGQPAPWTGALFSGELECGHRVEEGDMVRPVHGGDDGVAQVTKYRITWGDGTTELVVQSDPDEPQAWERPTAANVQMPELPTLPVDAARFLLDPQPAPWTGALSSGGLECGHRVQEGDMVRPVHGGDDETPTLECYEHCGQDDPACTCTTGSPEMYEGPARDCPEHGESVPQAWERPTAANVQMPQLPTLPVDAARVAKLEELRNHPASSAPVVGTVVDIFSAPLPVGLEPATADAVSDFFSAPLPVDPPPAAFDGTVPVPGRFQTSQYGYLIKDPLTGDFRRFKNGNIQGITRTTTFIKAASDSTALADWNKRNVVVGASRRPDLIAQAHGRDVSQDKDFLNDLVGKLETAADAKVSADIGTLVHTYTEQIDAGTIKFADVPPAYRGHVMSYRAALEAGGFQVVPHLLEGTIYMPQYGGVAGKFDRILFHVPSQTYVMGDLKTGKNMTYGWDEIEAQEWTYTTGYNEFGTYDWDTDTWTPPQYRVREDYGVVMWLPVQTPTKPYPAEWDVKANGAPQAGTCYLLKTDLQRGGRHAALCAAVREGRSNKGKPVRWEDPPVDWEARFRGVHTVEDAGRLWEQARAAGVAADALGYLVGLAQDSLRRIGSQLS